jgi:hypothetical protein
MAKCWVSTRGTTGRNRLTASGVPASATSGTASLTTSPPGGITTACCPPNGTGRAVPGATPAAPSERAAVAAPTASGVVP